MKETNTNKRGYYGSKTEFSKRDEYETPAYLVSYIRERFNPEVDLACKTTNAKFAKGIYIDEGRDSLKTDWHKMGKVGFCNPPYSDLGSWLQKGMSEAKKGFTSIFVIPTCNGDGWQKFVAEAKSMILINGRVNYVDPVTKKEMGGNNRGTQIVVFAPSRLWGGFGLLAGEKLEFINRNDLKGFYKIEQGLKALEVA